MKNKVLYWCFIFFKKKVGPSCVNVFCFYIQHEDRQDHANTAWFGSEMKERPFANWRSIDILLLCNVVTLWSMWKKNMYAVIVYVCVQGSAEIIKPLLVVKQKCICSCALLILLLLSNENTYFILINLEHSPAATFHAKMERREGRGLFCAWLVTLFLPSNCTDAWIMCENTYIIKTTPKKITSRYWRMGCRAESRGFLLLWAAGCWFKLDLNVVQFLTVRLVQLDGCQVSKSVLHGVYGF